MEFVIVDTEYTTWPGALEGGWSGPGQHREIVQVAAIRVDGHFAETASLDLLVRPAINPVLSPLFVSLTGIRQADVDVARPFAAALVALSAFVGDLPVTCMYGDEGVFRENCTLCGLEFPFARPWHRLRPYLDEVGVDTAANSSGDLHALTPEPLSGRTHDALHDVRSMARWLSHAAAAHGFRGLSQLPTGGPSRNPRSAPVRPG